VTKKRRTATQQQQSQTEEYYLYRAAEQSEVHVLNLMRELLLDHQSWVNTSRTMVCNCDQRQIGDEGEGYDQETWEKWVEHIWDSYYEAEKG